MIFANWTFLALETTLSLFPVGHLFTMQKHRMCCLQDGIDRQVIRGPEMLTADAETSMGMTREQVLEMEMDGFADLIRTINRYGTVTRF